jgi:hypothetical protein
MQRTIILDSNIWLAEQMLRHSAGSTFRFYVRTNGIRVAVPEVVRREVVLNLSENLKGDAREMKDSHSRLLRVVGSMKELVLPSDEELVRTAEKAFENARVEIIDIPFSLESARASFEKCLRGEPPSGPKNQQFKDGVLWADCIRLAAESPVTLVTSDKDFYAERKYERGLAPNLLAEAEGTPYGVSAAHELAAVLSSVRIEIALDYDRLAAEFLAQIRQELNVLLGRFGFLLAERTGASHKLFATDNPAEAHLEFHLLFRCQHPDGREGLLDLAGDGRYSPAGATFSNLHVRREEFAYDDVDGRRLAKSAIMMVGTMVAGHRTVHHEIRVPLAEIQG